MDWGAHLYAVLACAFFGLGAGFVIPRLVGHLPEPAASQPAASQPVDKDEPKPLYRDLAATPGAALWTAAWSALVAALFAARLGWAWELVYLLPLVPVGVALAWVDFRTRLLPRLIVAPTYIVLIVLLVTCSILTRDPQALLRAALGWLIAGFVFWFLWRFTPGMGYGDVRLSGVLGMALGFLGWGEFLLGTYGGFLLGSVGWIPLRLLRITKDRHFPFGPFMLLGAVLGVLWGADLLDHLVHRQP